MRAPRDPAGRPRCGSCEHYYVTWDSRAPHGCRAFGFKSARLPSVVVYSASGLRCRLYREGAGRRDGPGRVGPAASR